jgi:hypothetical protein
VFVDNKFVRETARDKVMEKEKEASTSVKDQLIDQHFTQERSNWKVVR